MAIDIIRPGQRKIWTKRVSLTLPRNVILECREIARIMGCSLSKVLRLRQEVRGPIVAVPEAVTEDLRTIRELLEAAMRTGFFDPRLLATWKERVEFYNRLFEFDDDTTFVKKKQKRRSSQKKKDEPTAKKKAASLESKAVAHPESGVVGC